MIRDNADNKERMTITSLAEKLLANGQAKTKVEATAAARLEVAKKKAAEAAAKVKEIEAAKKRLEREQAKKERFAKTQKERKDRTRRLIQGGGLLEKAGLLDWDAATLLGGLLALKNQDPKQLESFKTAGVNAFKAESSAAGLDQRGPGKILVRFPGGNPGKDVLDAMKIAGKGWKWDGENAVWTGEAAPDAVRKAVAPVMVEIEDLRA